MDAASVSFLTFLPTPLPALVDGLLLLSLGVVVALARSGDPNGLAILFLPSPQPCL